MGAGAEAKDNLHGTFFVSLFKDYIYGAIPKYKTIDGAIERLNRRTLATIFVLLFVIAIQDGILGAKIHCNGFETFRKKRFVKDYCWTQGLFTNRFAYNKPREKLPAPGVVPCIRAEDGFECTDEEKKKQQVYHLWYQWVPMYFALSAAAFFLPHILTKMTIIGQLSRFVDELQVPEELLGDEGGAKKLGNMLAKWTKLNLNPRYGTGKLRQHRVPITELITKAAYLATSSVHFWITAKMFPIGNYYLLGLLWHKPSSDNYTHIGDVLFPKLVGCNIKKYSLTGLNEESGMCTLPPNVVFQYLFLVTWWCVVVISALNIINLMKSVVVIIVNKCGYTVYRYNLEVTYDKTEGEKDINDAFLGPTKDDTKLVFAYYDLSSHMMFHKISDNIHPAIMAFGLKFMAAEIKDLMSKDGKLAEAVKKELRDNIDTSESNPIVEDPGPSFAKEVSKSKMSRKKGYKKVDVEESKM